MFNIFGLISNLRHTVLPILPTHAPILVIIHPSTQPNQFPSSILPQTLTHFPNPSKYIYTAFCTYYSMEYSGILILWVKKNCHPGMHIRGVDFTFYIRIAVKLAHPRIGLPRQLPSLTNRPSDAGFEWREGVNPQFPCSFHCAPNPLVPAVLLTLPVNFSQFETLVQMGQSGGIWLPLIWSRASTWKGFTGPHNGHKRATHFGIWSFAQVSLHLCKDLASYYSSVLELINLFCTL